jgi:hypothetical protein
MRPDLCRACSPRAVIASEGFGHASDDVVPFMLDESIENQVAPA